MVSGPGITDPDGFNDQALPLAFHLAVAGTLTSEGPLLSVGCLTGPHWCLGSISLKLGYFPILQISHQEACLPISRTAPIFRNVVEFIRMNNSLSLRSLFWSCPPFTLTYTCWNMISGSFQPPWKSKELWTFVRNTEIPNNLRPKRILWIHSTLRKTAGKIHVERILLSFLLVAFPQQKLNY